MHLEVAAVVRLFEINRLPGFVSFSLFWWTALSKQTARSSGCTPPSG